MSFINNYVERETRKRRKLVKHRPYFHHNGNGNGNGHRELSLFSSSEKTTRTLTRNHVLTFEAKRKRERAGVTVLTDESRQDDPPSRTMTTTTTATATATATATTLNVTSSSYEKIAIDGETAEAIQKEVESMCRHLPMSVCRMATTLADSETILFSFDHSDDHDCDGNSKGNGNSNGNHSWKETKKAPTKRSVELFGIKPSSVDFLGRILNSLNILALSPRESDSDGAAATAVAPKRPSEKLQRALWDLADQHPRLLSNRNDNDNDKSGTAIHNWEEAKAILETVLDFPTTTKSPSANIRTSHTDTEATAKSSSLSSSPSSLSKILQDSNAAGVFNKTISRDEYGKEISNHAVRKGHMKPGEQWKTISFGFHNKFTEPDDHDSDHARLLEAKSRRSFELSSTRVEQMMEEKARKQAEETADKILRKLTPEEKQIVQTSIYGNGDGSQVLATCGTDSVQRDSMRKLRPGAWLNDEVIHYFLVMLSKRDEERCRQEPTRKRTHFFKSFFITKLLDEDPSGYRYNNVKRWSKKVPGKDIFNLDKIIFPVNVSGMHWSLAVAFMQKKRIQFYDSMGGTGRRYLTGLLRYLNDEHVQKKDGQPLQDMDKWELLESQPDTPSQENGYDCGVFTCMFADFVSQDLPLAFSQHHVTECRERIALSIMSGQAIE